MSLRLIQGNSVFLNEIFMAFIYLKEVESCRNEQQQTPEQKAFYTKGLNDAILYLSLVV